MCNIYKCFDILQEMLIRPVLLDFLEQALESIPIILSKNSSKNCKWLHKQYNILCDYLFNKCFLDTN